MGDSPRLGESRSRHPSVGLQAGKEAGLAKESSKSKLCGHEVGLPGWPMLLRGNWVRNPRCPIHELWARTNEDKGKDGQGWVKGKDGQGQVYGQGWAGTMMGWDNRSWMPTHLGESQAWTPRQEWHKYSLR